MQQASAKFLFALLVCGTVLGLSGTDLVLPAVPSLPNVLSGNLEQAQLVIAAFVGGASIGLIVFGELGARFDQRKLLLIALTAYAVASYAATLVSSIPDLVAIRLAQGFVSSAPAVFAPGIIRSIFNEQGALRAIGLMGSIESLTPAFAPVIGAWMLSFADWRASFSLTAVLAALIVVILLTKYTSIPRPETRQHKAGYWSLFKNREFIRQTLSHACTLGGLLIFVFGAPTVIIITMGGQLSDFVVMQLIGISFFIVSSNLTHILVSKVGRDRIIFIGSAMTALGCGCILIYGLLKGSNAKVLWLLFIPVNLGLGLRSPPGFHKALIAAGDNDARGAALLILAILSTAALGTAVAANFIEQGIVPLSLIAFVVSFSSVITLSVLKPKIREL